MKCPYCKSKHNKVISLYQTLSTGKDEFRRVRRCDSCKKTFATRETYSPKTFAEEEEVYD